MQYAPLNFEQINVAAGSYNPSTVKAYDNDTFSYWQRSLFQRACSVLKFELPESWQGNVKDFFLYCLFKYGYVIVFNSDDYGTIFQPGSLSGYNVFYQPVEAVVSNPAIMMTQNLKISEDCELIKLTPDYFGIFDIINYYAEKLSTLDAAINMNIINSKLAIIAGAKSKSAGMLLKKIFDKVNQGNPGVVYDENLVSDQRDKSEPWHIWERKNLKESYLVPEQLQDFQTLLNNFDTEIGIPTIPYAKKERMVASEAESRIIDSTSRATTWFNTLESSISKVNAMFDLNISVELRYPVEEVNANGQRNFDN